MIPWTRNNTRHAVHLCVYTHTTPVRVCVCTSHSTRVCIQTQYTCVYTPHSTSVCIHTPHQYTCVCVLHTVHVPYTLFWTTCHACVLCIRIYVDCMGHNAHVVECAFTHSTQQTPGVPLLKTSLVTTSSWITTELSILHDRLHLVQVHPASV